MSSLLEREGGAFPYPHTHYISDVFEELNAFKVMVNYLVIFTQTKHSTQHLHQVLNRLDYKLWHQNFIFAGSTEVPSKVFLLLFLLSDWLEWNHLKSRIERGFLTFLHVIFAAP